LPQKNITLVAMMKDTKMSQQGRREVVEWLRHRYLQAGRAEKSKILDQFVALSGLHRKVVIRAMHQGYKQGRKRRGRKRVYTGAVVAALLAVCRVCGGICRKRLQPFLPEMVAALHHHGELTLDAETRDLLLQMSAATIDRILRRYKQHSGRGLRRPSLARC
jgi:ferric-dicitrate binding protein FerR (iron transport regulator)